MSWTDAEVAALTDPPFDVHPIGRVVSPLLDPADAPRQGDEGAPAAWIVGSYDGVIGWGALAWIALILALLMALTRAGDLRNSAHGS